MITMAIATVKMIEKTRPRVASVLPTFALPV